MEGGTIERVPVVCNMDHLLDYIKEKAVDEVMINLPGNKRENRELAYRLLEMGVVVHLTMDYHEDEFPTPAMERIGGYTVLTASINTAGSLPLDGEAPDGYRSRAGGMRHHGYRFSVRGAGDL